jgi:hypothetical protein
MKVSEKSKILWLNHFLSYILHMIWIKLHDQNLLISILHDIVDPFLSLAALNISLQPMSLNKTHDLNI